MAFSQWARNLGRLVLISLIPLAVMVPLGIAAGVLAYLTVTDSRYLVPLVVSVVVLVLAFLSIATAASAGSYLILDDQALGGVRNLGVWQAFGMGFRYFWRLLGVGILIALVMAAIAAVPVAVGFLSLPAGILLGLGALVLMIWLGIRWIAVWPSIVIEDAGAIEAFGRSSHLTRGSFWSIFATLILMFLIFLGIGIVLVLLGLIPILGQLISLAANVLLGPLSIALVFGIYAGLRDRSRP